MKQILGFTVVTIFAGCVMDSDRDASERVGEAALAVSSDVSATFSLDGLFTTITTGEMPKGWFGPAANKTLIYVGWSMAPTNCGPAMTGGMSSSNTGSMIPVLNPNGKVNGYWWSVVHDLTGMENHWHNQVACDGSTTVVGCPGARTVSYILSVNGGCLADGGICSVNGSVSLPAIQDPDVIETNCTVDCDALLGADVSACQASCANGDSHCHSCCECICKKDLHGRYDACPAPQSNCYVDKPNHDACLQMVK
jgi:hypothetical protein